MKPIRTLWKGTAFVPGGPDPFWSSVKLLLGFEGPDASTTITDESPSARGNAFIGSNAQIDTAQFKFGSSSLLLAGTGDNAEYSDSGDWTFASSVDFTIEAWIRFSQLTGFQTIVSQWDETGSNNGWIFDFPGSANNVLRFTYSTDSSNSFSVQGAWTPSIDTWYHVVADKSSGTLRVYAHGIMVASAGSIPSFADVPVNLKIGSIGDVLSGEQNEFTGWIDELRITRGVARYASDSGYTVPTAAFPRN